MHSTTQPHAPRRHVANWRLCWRELMYVTLFMCSAQAVIHGQVLRALCPQSGAQQPETGPLVPMKQSWVRQVLCMSMLYRSSTSGAAGDASAPVLGSSGAGLLGPVTSICSKVLDHTLVSRVPGGDLGQWAGAQDQPGQPLPDKDSTTRNSNHVHATPVPFSPVSAGRHHGPHDMQCQQCGVRCAFMPSLAVPFHPVP
jgi:hypothetical protein